MAAKYSRPRGTQDVLPAESWKWRRVEKEIRNLLYIYAYNEVRLPTFENTEVFLRGVGDTTDIASKEMYTFTDKGGRSVTLRPEGTAGVARAVLENGLLNSEPLPLKMYYIQSCFRYEKAQKGRLREFHQTGIECFGTQEAEADAEVIAVGDRILRSFGLRDKTTLEINSIGCPKCRPAYYDALKKYFEADKERLCETCIERLDKNPMRILDCKSEICAEIAKNAPETLDYLCEECAEHFGKVKYLLNEAEIGYKINTRIVRGLDYYTKTVFEFIAEGIGTQGTVCAGGRYDGLVETLGGQHTAAVGFGLGMERLLMLMEEAGSFDDKPLPQILYAVGIGDSGRKEARKLVLDLREQRYSSVHDISHRSIKAQMKAAGRSGALFTVVLGDDEAQRGKAMLKCMADGSEAEINLETAVLQIANALSQYALNPEKDMGSLEDCVKI